MTSAELQIIIKAKDEASGALGNIEKKAGGVGKAFGDMGKIAGGFVMAQGLMSAPGFLMGMAQSAADDAASVAKLQQAVENSGASWEKYKGQLEGVVEAAQKRGFTDDEARDALSLLTAQTGDAGEAAKRFAMAQDLARGANIDVYTASKLLGKVTDENVNVLARYGIKVAEGATETELFGAIQQKFGGQAEVFAKSSAGQMAAAKIQMSELKESIGYALLPVMTKLVDVLTTKIIPAVQKLAADWIPRIKQGFADMKTAVQPVIDALRGPFKDALAFIMDHKEMVVGALTALALVIGGVLLTATISWAAAMIAATWPILAVIAAGALLGLAIKELIDHWDEIKAKTLEVWDSISDFLDEKLGFLRGIFETAFTYYRNVAVFVFAEIKNYIETTINVIKDIITIVMALLKGDWSAAWEGMKQLVTDVWEGIKGAIMPAVDLIRNQLQLLWDVTEGLRGFLADKFQPVWTGLSWVFGAVQGVLGKLRDGFQWVIDKVYALKDAVSDALGPLGDLIDKAGDFLEMGGGVLGGLGDLAGKAVGKKASGGWASGLTWVGERGPELLALPGGSRVYSNAESRQMVSQSSNRSQVFYGPITVQVSSSGASLEEELARLLR